MRPRQMHGGAGTLVLCVALFLASAGCEPSIEGRVTDWATGDPVAGAQVSLWDSDCDWEVILFIPLPTDCETWQVTSASTDAGGHYALNDFPRKKELKLEVSKEGYVTHSEAVKVEWGRESVDVRLYPQPPSPVTELRARGILEGIELTWVNPADENFAGTLIVKEATDGLWDDTQPEHGRAYVPGDAVGLSRAVYVGTGSRFVDGDVVDGVLYTYRAFSFSDLLVYSTEDMEGIIFDSTPPEPPGDATISSDGPWVDVSWWISSDARGAIVVRSVGGPLEGAPEQGREYSSGDALGSGTVIYVTTNYGMTEQQWAHDTDAPAGAHVFYAIFAYDSSYNYSEGATVDIQL
jgi:hypothetical protein